MAQHEGTKIISEIDGWTIIQGEHEEGTLLWIAQSTQEIEMKGRASKVLKVTEAVVAEAHDLFASYSYVANKGLTEQLGTGLSQPEPIPIKIIAELKEIKFSHKKQQQDQGKIGGLNVVKLSPEQVKEVQERIKRDEKKG